MFDNNQPIELLDCDSLSLHPVVHLFPELSEERFDRLMKSIRDHGQIDAVWITSKNEIFDGRHRWMAQKRLGQKVLCRRLTDAAPALMSFIVDRVIAQNIERRQLTAGQRAMVAATLEERKAQSLGMQSKSDPIAETALGDRSADTLKKFDIKSGQLTRAKTILSRNIPELNAMVDDGKIGLFKAARAAKKLDNESIVVACNSNCPEIELNRKVDQYENSHGAGRRFTKEEEAIFMIYSAARSLNAIDMKGMKDLPMAAATTIGFLGAIDTAIKNLTFLSAKAKQSVKDYRNGN